MAQSKIVLAAGGTGGHVFPAVAVATELEKMGYTTEFFTDVRGEKYLKNQKYKIINSASPNSFKALGKLVLGFFESLAELAFDRPKVVVGFGGYPSFPPLLAAKVLFIKTVLHEQNAVQGLANRVLAKVATKVANTGNPVRPDIKFTPYPAKSDKLNILITGGSQGAKLFADIIPKALSHFAGKLNIVHQAAPDVAEEYKKLGIDAVVQPFFDDMPKRLEWAHLVICRAGASTIAEAAVSGRPAIFIPLKIAADDHQRKNAESVVAHGGGSLILEDNFNAKTLASLLEDLTYEKLQAAAEQIAKLAKPRAAKDLADLIVSL
jgi:UDP-N-acetylglucosamine--N-acetylmuramyl-(pentapeptide) pyrophosphoryl-undecaprenol N-acetylglucosamine transferase